MLKLIFFLILLFNQCIYANSKNDIELNIAVAANIKHPLELLSKEFSKKNNTQINLIVNSSGALSTLIHNSAPIDIFISADMNYPLALYDNGFSSKKPDVYARGVLIYITDKNNFKKSETINELLKKADKIAIANPLFAPYGKAAKQFLQNQKLFELINNKLVYGKSILQVNQYIFTKAVDGAFSALSIVYSPFYNSKDFNYIIINENYYEAIDQGVILIDKKKSVNKSALKFYNFLLNDFSQNIFKNNGYKLK